MNVLKISESIENKYSYKLLFVSLSIEMNMNVKTVDLGFVEKKVIGISEIKKEEKENVILKSNNMQPKSSQRKRCPFLKEEDDLLMYFVNQFGTENKNIWKFISQHMNGRSPRQCRERYNLFLNENVRKKTKWTAEEDNLIFYHFSQIGPHWKNMEKYFDGRTSYDLKNRYNSLIRQRKSYKNNPQLLFLFSLLCKKKRNFINKLIKDDRKSTNLQINSSFCYSCAESKNDDKINNCKNIKENSKEIDQNDDVFEKTNHEDNNDFVFNYDDYFLHSDYFDDISPNDSY